jgi:hypothetical protein
VLLCRFLGGFSGEGKEEKKWNNLEDKVPLTTAVEGTGCAGRCYLRLREDKEKHRYEPVANHMIY